MKVQPIVYILWLDLTLIITNMKSFKLILVTFYGILFLNQTTSIQAQQKKYLMREDYKLWSDFGASNLSDDGKWVYYNLFYKDTDTLFLVDKTKNITHSFIKSYNASFTPNSKWFGFIKKDSLHILNLTTGKEQLVSTEVKEYSFSFDGSYIIALVQTKETKSLKIVDLKTFKTNSVSNVIEYEYSPNKTKMAISTKQEDINKVSLYDLNSFNLGKVIITNSESEFKGLQWDDSSTKLAFFKEIKDSNLSYKNHLIYWCNDFGDKFILKETRWVSY
ncbi:hypothetical protein SAMN02745938_1012 [Flavobacterium psychrophilum DSM 3660]|nr:hypothetical protein SAMN02745938_1012 [Flavobacterium psychrophilum DSM 3660] [Flavobacterium psychrophilum DSM 3660 = ATCC 49418]